MMRLRGALLWLVFLSAGAAPAFGGLSLAEETQKTASSGTLDFANGLYSRKMYGPAISEYEKFIQSSPDSSEAAAAYFRMADSYYFLKDYPRAVERFEQYLLRFPKDSRVPIAFFRIGTANYYQKKYDVAELAFSKVAGTGGDETVKSGALFYLAKTAEARGNRAKALGLLRHVTAEYPDSEYATYACLAAGDIFAARKKTGEAVRVYGIIADRGTPPLFALEATLKIADLYFSEKRYLDARFYYQKAYEKGGEETRVRTLAGLFYCNYYLKDLDAAKALYRDGEPLLKGTALGADVEYLLAVLAHEKGDYDYALERAARVSAEPAASPETKKKAQAAQSFIRAEGLREKGDLEGALTAYREVLGSEDGPYFRPALYQSGFLSAELKKTSDARELFSKYITKYNEGDEVERASLEKIQMDLNDEKFKEAGEGADAFLKSHPQSKLGDVALYKLGMAQAGEKDFARASATFERLAKEFPQSELYADALYGAAAGYDSSGNTKKAIAFYEKIDQGFPAYPLYADVVQRLGFLYVQSGDLAKAAEFYEDVILHKPQVPVESSVAFWTIRYDLDHGLYERMKPVLSLLPKRYPDEQLAHEINFFLGESLMGSKNYDEAQKYYLRALNVRADGAYAAHAQLGLGIVAAAKGRLDDADGFFAKALGYPNEVDVALRARFEMANLRLRKNQLDEAAKAFMHVAILYDDEKYCSASLFKAGECFDKLGNAPESRQAFEELVRRYPKTDWARQAAAFLKKEPARG